ncbi:Protein kinase domain [Macleaya cordata]|uniref:non-specific serine/threonine protein kinase n=1 Tax=Macleaya cordata TaxID=56857 RepID=A0A200R536_MACCD|nr:Protein kinase domain [Macleaya cordata]
MKASIPMIILTIFFCSLHHPSLSLSPPMLNNSTDRDALLSFKSSITDDPNGILNTWSLNTSFCNWNGVLCNPKKLRVTGLALGNLSLSGTISPHLTNLSFLRVLDLQNNSFSGSLPREIGRLFRLETLIVASNSIHGTIPSSLRYCFKLRVIDLSENRIEGTIPPELGELSKLEDLSFAKNNLTGTIPSSLGNISSLNNLILMSNNLHGLIPPELGRLHLLLQLHLADNNITGQIPTSLYNISSLIIVSLAKNRISDRLPSDLFTKLPRLGTLFVGGNLLEGPIPASLSNASNLERLDLSVNRFTGGIPLLQNLPNIEILNLEINELVSDDEHGLEFIGSLANSTLLQVFSVATNQLTGRLPASIGNLSRQLSLLVMAENHFEGNIPAEIGNLGSLSLLALESNSFTGRIPSTIANLKNLQRLSLFLNHLSGPIPESLGNLTKLFELDLNTNNFSGRIPSSLSNCQSLQYLDLSLNRLDQEIPKEIFAFPSLGTLLNLSSNYLTGSLPTEIGNLKMVQAIDISKNNLSGTIPPTIGDCSNLLYLDLSRNSFQGSIPDSLAKLKGIEYIDLSSNSLSGTIPSSLESLKFLQLLNLSVNQLQGEVPNKGIFLNSTIVSLDKNKKLCGGVPKLGLPHCAATKRHSNRSKMRWIIGVLVGSVALFVLLSLIVFLFFYWRAKSKSNAKNTEDSSIKNPNRLLYSYYDLRAATDNFNSKNLIGEGSFGSVFRGVARDGTVVAIKVFNMDQHGASKSFLAECEALRNIRHRNLVKIITACSTSEFKALVLQFMPNGSLENWLYNTSNVASAMEYLHHECETAVVHCDLKPSNVLLNEDMTAHVCDFGLARMLHLNSSDNHTNSTLGLKGSIGYIAPEYGLGGGVSTKGDVYSYGILLLEMFTGKRPTNEVFRDGLNLKKWTELAFPDRVMEILDDNLVEDDCEMWKKDCVVSVIKIGLLCTNETPEERPSMRDVSAMIKRVRHIIH